MKGCVTLSKTLSFHEVCFLICQSNFVYSFCFCFFLFYDYLSLINETCHFFVYLVFKLSDHYQCVLVYVRKQYLFIVKKKKHLQIILNKDKLRDYSKSPDI